MTGATDVLGLEAVTVDTSLGRMRIFVGGDGPPVALLHGLSASAATWLDVVRGLRGRHRLVVLDLPGHGGSSALGRGADLGRYADAVAAGLDALDAAPALVAGHSFGGQVALRLALTHPSAVRALLLVAPSGVVPLAPRTRALGTVTTLVRPGALAAPLGVRLATRAWFRRVAFRPWLVADAASLSPAAARAFFLELRAHADVRGAFRALCADPAVAPGTALPCRTIVLWGAEDRIVPVDNGIAAARCLGASLRVVADAGHLVVAERPCAVLDALAALA